MTMGHATRATVLGLLALGTLLSVLGYLGVRTVLFLLADYAWYEKTLAAALLLAEIFTLVHGFGYLLNILRVTLRRRPRAVTLDGLPEPESFPPVAVVVSSFREPLEVVEETLICFYNLTYPNKRIYFLDDTRYDMKGWDPDEAAAYRAAVDQLCERIGVCRCRRVWRGAKAGMINDFLAFVQGRPPRGFEFVSHDGVAGPREERYIVVFDADMNPFPDFAEPLVALMERDLSLIHI